MKYKINYFRRHIFSLKNIILFVIFFLISLGLIFLVSIVITFNNLKNTVQKYNVGFRTLIVESKTNNYDALNDIKHIVIVEDSIYKSEIVSEVTEFDSNLKGVLTLKTILDSKSIKIVYGKNLEKTGEAICSNSFYPHTLSLVDNQFKFYKSEILNPKDVLNKTFSITSSTDQNIIKSFKIVGFYDSQINENSLNTCYISKEDFKLLASPYEGAIVSYDENGNEIITPIEYKGKVIVIDKLENIKYVEEKLRNLNFSYYPYSEIDSTFIKIVTYIPIFSSIILILILVWLVNLFVKKKINDKNKIYAILKVTGYTDKQIIRIDVVENIIISIIAFILSIIIYIILFEILKYKYLIDYLYQGINVHFSVLSILIAFVIVESIIVIVNKITLKHRLNNSINKIVGSI